MQENKRPPAWLMIVTAMLVTLVAVVCARLAYGLILPFMRQNLGLSYQQAGNLGTASALGYLCLVMTAGVFAARRGGRAAILVGLCLTTAGFIGLTLSSHYLVLMAFMAMLGFGTAFAYTPVISLMATWFPERRGAVIGATNSGVGIGLASSGAVVPWLNQAYGADGWRVTWGVFAAVSVLAVTSVFAFLRNPPSHQVGGTSVSKAERRAVYRNPQVFTVGMLYGITGVTYIAQAIFMFSFTLDAGVSAQTAGHLAAITGLLSILSSPFWGWLSDRFERASVLMLAVALNLIATIVPVIWPTLPGFTFHYLLIGCTISGMFTSVLAAASSGVAPQQAPLAISFVTLFYAIGQLVGPALAGLLIEHAGGFRAAFGVSCAVMCVGVALAWRLRRLRLAANAQLGTATS